jgi:hypothetical protein
MVSITKETIMIDLTRYLEVIVDPTYEEFKQDPDARRAFLTCVVIYHAIDRVAWQSSKSVAALRQEWARKSLPFKLVDIIAHHLKHVESTDEQNKAGRPGLPIERVLGFGDAGDQLELRHLWFVIRDAVKFLHDQVQT